MKYYAGIEFCRIPRLKPKDTQNRKFSNGKIDGITLSLTLFIPANGVHVTLNFILMLLNAWH